MEIHGTADKPVGMMNGTGRFGERLNGAGKRNRKNP